MASRSALLGEIDLCYAKEADDLVRKRGIMAEPDVATVRIDDQAGVRVPFGRTPCRGRHAEQIVLTRHFQRWHGNMVKSGRRRRPRPETVDAQPCGKPGRPATFTE
ncbi:MAG: hypothetical protein IPF96_19140 [Rhodobacter sp.]|nr:hypothetical protein [Rhodobacter sp.]